MSKKTAKEAITAAMSERGGTLKDFAALTATGQQAVFRTVMNRRKPTEREERRKGAKPVDEHLYASQKNYVERHGGMVVRGGEEVEAHLDSRRADAAYIGDTILLRKDATTSEVIEEVFHFQQGKRGDYADIGGAEMLTLREIDAQRYLLDVSERYNIPESEIEQTKANLQYHEQQLVKIRERKGLP